MDELNLYMWRFDRTQVIATFIRFHIAQAKHGQMDTGYDITSVKTEQTMQMTAYSIISAA